MLVDHSLREKTYRNLLRFIEPLATDELAAQEDWLGICPLQTIETIPSHLYNKATILSQRFIQVHAIAAAQSEGRTTDHLDLKETCVICGSAIAFEDLFEARCKGSNVHSFGSYLFIILDFPCAESAGKLFLRRPDLIRL